MQFITETAARAAAAEIGRTMRAELREELAAFERSMLANIQSEMRAYFGEMNGNAHIVQHSKLNEFLEARSNAVKGFVTRAGELVAAGIVTAILFVAGIKGFAK